MLTYCEVLRVSPSATLQDIQKAYRQQVKTCHPDLFHAKSPREKRMAELRFKLVNEAYNGLKNKSIQTTPNRKQATNDNKTKNNDQQTLWSILKEIIWPVGTTSHR